jgi:hypothetical protein
MDDEPENESTGSPAAKRADELLDEAIAESFPASDPESSWSGLSEPDLRERPDDDSDDAPT